MLNNSQGSPVIDMNDGTVIEFNSCTFVGVNGVLDTTTQHNSTLEFNSMRDRLREAKQSPKVAFGLRLRDAERTIRRASTRTFEEKSLMESIAVDYVTEPIIKGINKYVEGKSDKLVGKELGLSRFVDSKVVYNIIPVLKRARGFMESQGFLPRQVQSSLKESKRAIRSAFKSKLLEFSNNLEANSLKMRGVELRDSYSSLIEQFMSSTSYRSNDVLKAVTEFSSTYPAFEVSSVMYALYVAITELTEENDDLMERYSTKVELLDYILLNAGQPPNDEWTKIFSLSNTKNLEINKMESPMTINNRSNRSYRSRSRVESNSSISMHEARRQNRLNRESRVERNSHVEERNPRVTRIDSNSRTNVRYSRGSVNRGSAVERNSRVRLHTPQETRNLINSIESNSRGEYRHGFKIESNSVASHPSRSRIRPSRNYVERNSASNVSVSLEDLFIEVNSLKRAILKGNALSQIALERNADDKDEKKEDKKDDKAEDKKDDKSDEAEDKKEDKKEDKEEKKDEKVESNSYNPNRHALAQSQGSASTNSVNKTLNGFLSQI